MARDGLTVSCWAGQLSGVVLISGRHQVGEEGGRGGAQEPRPLAQPTGQPLQALFRVRNRLKNGRYYLFCLQKAVKNMWKRLKYIKYSTRSKQFQKIY